jgi:hypothetical protein
VRGITADHQYVDNTHIQAKHLQVFITSLRYQHFSHLNIDKMKSFTSVALSALCISAVSASSNNSNGRSNSNDRNINAGRIRSLLNPAPVAGRANPAPAARGGAARIMSMVDPRNRNIGLARNIRGNPSPVAAPGNGAPGNGNPVANPNPNPAPAPFLEPPAPARMGPGRIMSTLSNANNRGVTGAAR